MDRGENQGGGAIPTGRGYAMSGHLLPAPSPNWPETAAICCWAMAPLTTFHLAANKGREIIPQSHLCAVYLLDLLFCHHVGRNLSAKVVGAFEEGYQCWGESGKESGAPARRADKPAPSMHLIITSQLICRIRLGEHVNYTMLLMLRGVGAAPPMGEYQSRQWTVTVYIFDRLLASLTTLIASRDHIHNSKRSLLEIRRKMSS